MVRGRRTEFPIKHNLPTCTGCEGHCNVVPMLCLLCSVFRVLGSKAAKRYSITSTRARSVCHRTVCLILIRRYLPNMQGEAWRGPWLGRLTCQAGLIGAQQAVHLNQLVPRLVVVWGEDIVSRRCINILIVLHLNFFFRDTKVLFTMVRNPFASLARTWPFYFV